jgi:hypothetical protein
MKNRLAKVIIGFWLFLNLILFLIGWGRRGYFLFHEHTWDRHYSDWTDDWIKAGSRIDSPVEDFYLVLFNIEHYDITEFLIIGMLPILILISIKYVKKGKFL